MKVKDHLEALDHIGQSGASSDIPYIINHIFSKNKQISNKAATKINKIMLKYIAKKQFLILKIFINSIKKIFAV